MKECDSLREVKTYSDPSYIFSVGQNPQTLGSTLLNKIWSGIDANSEVHFPNFLLVLCVCAYIALCYNAIMSFLSSPTVPVILKKKKKISHGQLSAL